MECSATDRRHLYPAARLSDRHRRGSRVMERARSQEDWSKTLSSARDKSPEAMDSQQPWLPAEDLRKIKPVGIPAWRRRDCEQL